MLLPAILLTLIGIATIISGSIWAAHDNDQAPAALVILSGFFFMLMGSFIMCFRDRLRMAEKNNNVMDV